MTTRQILTILSVLGEVDDFGALLRLVRESLAPQAIDEHEVRTGLELLLDDGLVQRNGDRLLLVETASIDPPIVVGSHHSAQIASRAARVRHDRGADSDAVVALAGSGTGTETWLVPHLRVVAARRHRDGDLAAAAELLRNALAIASTTSDDDDRSPLAIDLAIIEIEQGDPEAAQRLVMAARRDLGLEGLRPLQRVAQAAEVLYVTGRIPQARALFGEALERLDRSADAPGVSRADLEARFISGLSTTSLLMGEPDAAVAARLATVRGASRTGDLATRALMSVAAGQVALGVDRPIDETRSLLDAAVGLDTTTVHLERVVPRTSVEPVAAVLAAVGRVGDSDRLLSRALEPSDTISPTAPSLFALRSYSRWIAGDLNGAAADAAHTIALTQANPALSQIADAPARFVAAAVAIERADLASASAVVSVEDHASRWAGSAMYGWFLHGRAITAAAEGDHSGAVADWRAAGQVFTASGATAAFGEWRFGLSRALAMLQRHDEAVEVATAMEHAARNSGDDRLFGLALVTLARLDVGEDPVGSAEVAVKLLRNTEARLDLCHTLTEAAMVARRNGQRSRARRWLLEAGPLARELGSVRATDSVAAELELLGEPDLAASRWKPTPAERRVAVLAAQGNTNREIAAQLTIGVKTVETHLSSVYRKLGIRSRRDLAARLDDSID